MKNITFKHYPITTEILQQIESKLAIAVENSDKHVVMEDVEDVLDDLREGERLLYGDVNDISKCFIVVDIFPFENDMIFETHYVFCAYPSNGKPRVIPISIECERIAKNLGCHVIGGTTNNEQYANLYLDYGYTVNPFDNEGIPHWAVSKRLT